MGGGVRTADAREGADVFAFRFASLFVSPRRCFENFGFSFIHFVLLVFFLCLSVTQTFQLVRVCDDILRSSSFVKNIREGAPFYYVFKKPETMAL